MSTRHRSEAPKPAPSERRAEHHRERQATRRALAAHAPEEVLDPRARRSLHADHADRAPEGATARQFRHWKARFWKRRSAVRHARNQALAALARLERAELALVPVPVSRTGRRR